MRDKKSDYNRHGWACYVAGGLLLCSIAMFFLPFVGSFLEGNRFVSFPVYQLVFGGEVIFDNAGHLVAFSFSENYWLFAFAICLALGALGSFLSRNATRELIISLSLSTVGFIGIAMALLITHWVNPGLPLMSLKFGWAFYVWVALAGSALILLVIALFRSRAYWRKRSVK